MDGPFPKLGAMVIGLIILVLLNLFFFGFVVGFDVIFGAPPQFTVPFFVPLLVLGLGTIINFCIARTRRSRSAENSSFNGTASSAGAYAAARGPEQNRRVSPLQSALVIRRQLVTQTNNDRRNSYAASV